MFVSSCAVTVVAGMVFGGGGLPGEKQHGCNQTRYTDVERGGLVNGLESLGRRFRSFVSCSRKLSYALASQSF